MENITIGIMIGIVFGVCWKLPLHLLLNILEWRYPDAYVWPSD